MRATKPLSSCRLIMSLSITSRKELLCSETAKTSLRYFYILKLGNKKQYTHAEVYMVAIYLTGCVSFQCFCRKCLTVNAEITTCCKYDRKYVWNKVKLREVDGPLVYIKYGHLEYLIKSQSLVIDHLVNYCLPIS